MPSNILVVDDDVAVLGAIVALLEPLGRVAGATDGATALRHLEAGEAVDLLVCDLHLPDSSGIDVIARARKAQPDLPALLLTAEADRPSLVDAINRAEVYRFFDKPVDLGDLFRTAQTALETAALRRERERLHQEIARSNAALHVLYEAARELSQVSGRSEIVMSALGHLSRAVPFDLGAVLQAPVAGNAALYLHAAAPVDETTLVSFKEQSLARFAARTGHAFGEHEVKLILLGAQVDGESKAPARVDVIEAPLEVGGELIGLVRLLRGTGAYDDEQQRFVGVLAGHMAQALRRDEDVLRSQRRQLDHLVRSMADGVVMLADEGEPIVANPAARQMLQLAGDRAVTIEALREKLGFHPFDLVRGWERGGAEALREEIAIGGRTLHSIVSPVLDGTGALAGVAVVLRDLTSEKELEHRKEEFVSVVSHELRTPLTSLSGCLDLLLRGYLGEIPEKQQRYVQMARDSCEKLNTIIDDLLDLSKYERGRLEVGFDRVDLVQLLQQVVERHQPAAAEKRIRLLWAGGNEAVVAGEAARLTQVLDNLLSNALKFTQEEGTIEVDCLTSEALTDHVGISVWNSGARIEERDIERIFEKFSQGFAPGKRKSRGTGLGLAISRGLIETHGGRLWAENGTPDGVRFVAVLPRLAGMPAAPKLDESLAAALEEAAGVKARRAVLVADRDLVTASLLKGVLLRYGLAAITATTADEALAAARHRDPSLVLLDPTLSGEESELLQILAHDPETRELPVLLTAPAGPAHAPSALAVERPFGSGELLHEVVRALRASSPNRAPHVLVVERDAEARRALEAALVREGYRVSASARPELAIAEGRAAPPDLVIAEVELEPSDGFELARALGAGRPGGPELIFMASRSTLAHKVRAFREGASDYLLKPIEPSALAERARAALRKRHTRGEATPTTRLPGSYAIERELRRRIAARELFACLHVTVDQIKEFNEAYGYGKADGVVQQIGDLVRVVLRSAGTPADFVGHVQRDHFVVITRPEGADVIGQSLLAALNRVLPLYYDREDRARGFLKIASPEGTRLAPLMSGCVVAVVHRADRFMEPQEIYAAARLTKQRGKAPGHPAYLRDELAEDGERRAAPGK